MIGDELHTLRQREREEREHAEAADDISARVSHLERARRYGEQIAALKAATALG